MGGVVEDKSPAAAGQVGSKGLHCCAVCGEEFASRNKLFTHVGQFDHWSVTSPREAAEVKPARSLGNNDFYSYYSLQGVAGSQSWDACYARFQEDLPLTFRVSECGIGGRLGPELVHAFLSKLGVKVEPAAYHNCDRLKGTRCLLFTCPGNAPGLGVLQELGLIQRQEQNSALPPLLLDVNDSHLVLDMCAAPGSKSLQLLDLMLAEANCALPKGMLVSNDKDRERAAVLARRARSQPRLSLLVTNSDAKHYPTVRRRKQQFKMRFDRVLCDVPCSSDGTLRKQRHGRGHKGSLWDSWAVWPAFALHKVQMAILRRGLELCGPGGQLVYSTCSLNPLENEAVVAALLVLGEGSYRLRALPSVPGLLAEPGLRTWRVPDPAFSAEQPVLYASMEEAIVALEGLEETRNVKKRNRLLPTMFPPSQSHIVEQLPLCARVLPVHSDGGAFFVALFDKVKAVKVEPGACSSNAHVDIGPDLSSDTAAMERTTGAVVHVHKTVEHTTEETGVVVTEQADSHSIPEVVHPDTEELAVGDTSERMLLNGTGNDPEQMEEQRLRLEPKYSSPSAEPKPLLRAVPEAILADLVEKFGLSADSFPLASVFMRGKSLVIASETMAKVWCTNKSLQVLEAGQYLFSNVADNFSQWSIYSEATHLLATACTCRRIDVTSAGLDLLLSEKASVSLSQLLHVGATLHDGQGGESGSLVEGPVVLGLKLSHEISKGAAIAFLAARVDVSGVVALIDGACWTGAQWLTLLRILERAS